MAKTSENGKADREPVRIEELSVEGFKSIDGPLKLGIRPLTILAGANSSGKSSAIQPLLMMKQTLEATYDPGPLLLSGPNVNFTSVQQFLCLARVSGTEGSFASQLGTATRVESYFIGVPRRPSSSKKWSSRVANIGTSIGLVNS